METVIKNRPSTISYPVRFVQNDPMDGSYPGRFGSRLPSVNPTTLFNSIPGYQSESAASARSDVIPLLASVGLMAGESTNAFSREEAKEKMDQLSQLISRLEDTTTLLKDQLNAAKKALKDEKASNQRNVILKPILPWLFKYQILVVLVVQLLSTSILAGYDMHWSGHKGYDITSKVIMVICQALNTAHVVLATVKLSKKLKSGGLGTVMAQTYMATVIVFAGMYLTIYRFDHSSWEVAPTDDLNSENAFVQLVRMLYLSVSSATLCGAANIQPKAWFVTLIVCTQSLINFVYFASILAQTIGNFNSYTVSVRHRDSIVADALQQNPNVASNTSSVQYGSTGY